MKTYICNLDKYNKKFSLKIVILFFSLKLKALVLNIVE